MIIFGGFAFSRINNTVRPLPITMRVPFIFSYLFRNTVSEVLILFLLYRYENWNSVWLILSRLLLFRCTNWLLKKRSTELRFFNGKRHLQVYNKERLKLDAQYIKMTDKLYSSFCWFGSYKNNTSKLAIGQNNVRSLAEKNYASIK